MIATDRTAAPDQHVDMSSQSLRKRLERISATLMLWLNRSRQRRALSTLQDDQLKDIGISRVDALQESRKPFWKH